MNGYESTYMYSIAIDVHSQFVINYFVLDEMPPYVLEKIR